MAVWVWAIVLTSSLIAVVGFARAGSIVFWKARSVEVAEDATPPEPPQTLACVAVGAMVAMLIAHTVFAGQMHAYTTLMAEQLFAPTDYISTVVDTPGKMSNPKEGH